MRRIVLYTRVGCHLCEEAEAIIRRVASPDDQITLVDIDADPSLTDTYTVRVPVVEVDGVEVAQLQINEAALVATLTAPPRTTSRG